MQLFDPKAALRFLWLPAMAVLSQQVRKKVKQTKMPFANRSLIHIYLILFLCTLFYWVTTSCVLVLWGSCVNHTLRRSNEATTWDERQTEELAFVWAHSSTCPIGNLTKMNNLIVCLIILLNLRSTNSKLTTFTTYGFLYHRNHNPFVSREPPKVVATLVSLLFSIPGLDFDHPKQHVEAFSGCMSVSKGEWNEAGTIMVKAVSNLYT